MEGVPNWKLSSENQHTFNGISEKKRQSEEIYRQKSYFHFRLYTNSGGTYVIHPLARDVKGTLFTRKKPLTAESDSNSLLGVLLVCHKAKQYLPSPLFLVKIKTIIHRLVAARHILPTRLIIWL
jgi:hypothetical protein